MDKVTFRLGSDGSSLRNRKGQKGYSRQQVLMCEIPFQLSIPEFWFSSPAQHVLAFKVWRDFIPLKRALHFHG